MTETHEARRQQARAGRAPSIHSLTIGPRLLGKPLEKLHREIAARTLNAEIAWCLRAHAANSSSRAFASFRSRMSNPSVNHPYTRANSSSLAAPSLVARP